MKKLLIGLLTGLLVFGVSTTANAQDFPDKMSFEEVIESEIEYYLNDMVSDYEYDEEENKLTFYSDHYRVAQWYHIGRDIETETIEEGIQGFTEAITEDSVDYLDEPLQVEFTIYDKFFTNSIVYQSDNTDEIEDLTEKER